MENIESKIVDLQRWITNVYDKALGVEESLSNIRKSGQAICKIAILDHYLENGQYIIDGKRKMDGNSTIKEIPLNFNNLINIVCNASSTTNNLITDKNVRNRVKSYFEIIRINSNQASHDSDSRVKSLNTDDLEHTKNTLKYIISWLFKDQINFPIPESIKKHTGIMDKESYSYVNMRGKDIISIIYPKNENIEEEVYCDTSKKISYEFVSVDVTDNISIGYLFLNENIFIYPSLKHFNKKNSRFNNINAKNI